MTKRKWNIRCHAHFSKRKVHALTSYKKKIRGYWDDEYHMGRSVCMDMRSIQKGYQPKGSGSECTKVDTPVDCRRCLDILGKNYKGEKQ